MRSLFAHIDCSGPGVALIVLAASAVSACGPQGGAVNGKAVTSHATPAATPPRGHWYRATDVQPMAMTAEQVARSKALEGIGYAAGMEPAGDFHGGAQTLIPASTQPGFNFYTSGHGPDAFLIDSSGQVRHRWHKPIAEVWPDKDVSFAYFRKARLFSEGRVLAIFEGFGLVALDVDSNVLWTYDRPTHHDVHEAPDGSFYALDRQARVVPELHPDRPLLDDGIAFLETDGQVRGRVSLLDGLLNSNYRTLAGSLLRKRIAAGREQEAEVLKREAKRFEAQPELLANVEYIGDCMHSNSVRRVGAKFAASCDVLKEGWYLVSIRELNLLAAFEVSPDFQSAKARWVMQGPWHRQHEAVPLPSGRIMLYDNLGQKTSGHGRRSRVLDIDPATGSIASEIKSALGLDLASPVGGSCQRLENGNTLIIQSTRGLAVEVTPKGQTAWIFQSPHRAGEEGELIAFLPDVIRVPEALVKPWLPAASFGR